MWSLQEASRSPPSISSNQEDCSVPSLQRGNFAPDRMDAKAQVDASSRAAEMHVQWQRANAFRLPDGS